MKLNDRNLAGMLIDIFGAPVDLRTPEEVLEWAQSYCTCVNTPFSLNSVRIVYDRITVLAGALRPLNSAPLVDYLSEEQGRVILCSDQHSAGKEALFFASICDDTTIQAWTSRLNSRNGTRVGIGAKQNRMVIAASLLSFIT